MPTETTDYRLLFVAAMEKAGDAIEKLVAERDAARAENVTLRAENAALKAGAKPPVNNTPDIEVIDTVPLPVDPFAAIGLPHGEFKPLSVHTRQIYVSAAGDDKNDGSLAKPVRTWQRAHELARNGNADQILFRRGDTFADETRGISWKKRGPTGAPMLLATYGTGPMPQIGKLDVGMGTPDGGGLYVYGLASTFASRKGLTAKPKTDLIGKGNGGASFACSADLDALWVVGCLAECGRHGVSVTGKVKAVSVQGNVIREQWEGKGAQGVWISNSGGRILIDGNLLYQCGWQPAWDADWGGVLKYNHAIYLPEGSGHADVTNNTMIRPASHAAQLRGGGKFANNLVVEAGCVAFAENGTFEARDNVVSEMRTPRVGLHDLSVTKRSVVTGNLFLGKGAKPWAGTSGTDEIGGNRSLGWEATDGWKEIDPAKVADADRRAQTYLRRVLKRPDAGDAAATLAETMAAPMLAGTPDPRLTPAAINEWIRGGFLVT